MKKILFIEDESALQKTFKEALLPEGFELISALDGQEGLDLAKRIKPDLILLDLILPKIDGIEVLRKLREEESTAGIPVIVLTNLEEIEKIEKAMELGAKAYLIKAEYSLDEVIEKIKSILK